MKKMLVSLALLCLSLKSYCWGFFGHQRINYYAVFLLPPEMLIFYKKHIDFLSEHSTDPDKRRYAVAEEAARHYIDIDHYGKYPYPQLPRKWDDAVSCYSEDSLNQYGIVPWHIQKMEYLLTAAFREKKFSSILKYSAEIGHYIGDAHVPLHANSNHNGQLTGQKGIHGFWESRIPELLADKEFDFLIGQAHYIKDPLTFIWERVLESAVAGDSVLAEERKLTKLFAEDKKYGFEDKNGLILRQYSSDFTIAYNKRLGGMTERRMRQAIFAVASFWYTAWINAGQPDLSDLAGKTFSPEELNSFEKLNLQWKNTNNMIGRGEGGE